MRYKTTLDKLIKDKEKLNNKKDKLIELYSDDLINKEEFKVRNEDYSSQLKTILNNIEELENKNKTTVEKKDRLIELKEFFQMKLESKENLDDRIISHFLKEIIVSPDGSVSVTLNGDFTCVVSKENNSSKLPQCDQYKTVWTFSWRSQEWLTRSWQEKKRETPQR